MKSYLSGMPECKFGINDKIVVDSKVRILCFKFSLNPLRFSLTRETDTKLIGAVEVEQFAKLQLLKDKIDQTTILLTAKWPFLYKFTAK